MAYVVSISLDDFQSLPERVVPRTVRMQDSSLTGQKALDWIFIGYYEKLIRKNASLSELLEKHCDNLDNDAFVNATTKGQRLLLHLAALDGQTCNGGITQFIWNWPEMVLTALDALATLDYPELLTSYQIVIDRLELDIEEWTKLRISDKNGTDDMWDNFNAATQLINGSDFDDTYFDHVGATARRKAIEYVNSNLHDFIAWDS